VSILPLNITSRDKFNAFFEIFNRDDNISYEAAFQLCPDYTQYTICSWFNSWVAEAMGVPNESRKPQLQYKSGPLISK